jgi:membrane fusion protein (multidrug efflux system)
VVRVRPGQRAVVASEAFPGAEFEGRVAHIASVFDPNTNTTEAEVEIKNPDYRLKPGMFANVAVTFRTEPTALLVPKAALVEDERETYLFVAERVVPRPEGPSEGRPAEGGPRAGGPDGPPAGPSWTAKRVAVRRIGTGSEERHRGSVAVEGDLRAGQPVITLGQQDLRDGSPVRIAEDAPAPETTSAAVPGT